MCGILGEISKKNLLEAAEFRTLLDLSQRRGPDGQRIWSDKRAQFGFNRLSILDTSINGMQPMISPSGRYVIVLNGEIYNYKSLQRKYGIQDRQLRSGSDVEVVAHMTEIVDKSELPDLLNGMFALAIYDTIEQDLLLSRDFAGIKPLFYGITNSTLVFASQFDQVYKHPVYKNSLHVNPHGLRDFMALGYMQAPNTVYNDIHQLRPGETLLVNKDFETKLIRYSSYSSLPTNSSYAESSMSTVEAFKNQLDEVVKDQLVSDVPIGTFLSGGIDSPLITALAVKNNPGIKAFTFNVEDAELSELKQAEIYAKHLKVNFLSETLYPSEMAALCEEHFKAYHEPFGDASSLPTYIISKLAKKDLTVMLSGDGGDEVFWGYPRFLQVVNNAYHFKLPRYASKVVAGVQRKFGTPISYAINSFSNIGDWQLHKHAHLSTNFLNTLFGNIGHTEEVDMLYHYQGELGKEQILNWLRWNEFYAHMQRILIKVDSASMHNSLEVRVPLLDKRILDMAWQTKPELGITHEQPKIILKKLMEQYYSPAMVNHSKKGFGIPYGEYMRTSLRKDVEEVVLDTKLFGSDYYDDKLLKKYVHNYLVNNEGSPWGVWIVYAMQKWAMNYVYMLTIILFGQLEIFQTI